MLSLTKEKIIKLSITVMIIITASVLCATNAGELWDNNISDLLCQRGGSVSGNIILLEIDSHSLEELGPYQTWTRDYVAEAIERLNTSEDSRPAAIGVDVLYIGESYAESDRHLVEACSMADNVIVGTLINYDTLMREDGEGNYYMENAVSLYEEPFERLKQCTGQGFVNGYPDKDGVMRHARQWERLEDGRVVPSFAYAVYQKYAQSAGLPTDLDIPVNENGQWYIHYQAKPGGYSNGYSLSDFIQGEIPADRMAGAVVLIGPYAEGLQDSYITSIKHDAPMYGVEIYANMIDTMIKGEFKKELPMWQILLLQGMFIVVVCFMTFRPKLRYGAAAALTGSIGYIILGLVLYQLGYKADFIYVPFVSIIVPVCNVIVHYLKAVRQKREVERTFRRYVAPEVVDKIIKTGIDQIELGGAVMDIACLFVDIRGFTTLSEQLEAREVVEILNQYLELTSSCIFRHGGTLDKFIGDATMAVYNSPIPQEDYVYKAVLTAWDMVREAERLVPSLGAKYGKSVSFGVGVHCGEAVVGNIGTMKRMDFTAIGDTVNTAARLEANAPAGTVLISRNVVDRLGDRIDVESLGNLPLKGKSQELEIFKLINIKDDH